MINYNNATTGDYIGVWEVHLKSADSTGFFQIYTGGPSECRDIDVYPIPTECNTNVTV